MGKSQSEIQKAYRERQKAKGPAFLEKERRRQKQYYVPADQLSTRKREERNEKNKMRNRLCREKKRRQQNEKIAEETSGYETLNTEIEEVKESTDLTDAPESSTPLVVKLPALGQNVRRRNAKALSRAYRKIKSLELEIQNLKRSSFSKSKRIERLQSKKQETRQPKTGEMRPKDTQMTPKRKTMADIEKLELTPKRQRLIKRQLLTSNVLMHEINAAKEVSGNKRVNNIHRVVAGKLAKKYRCIKSIGKGVSVCRKALAQSDGKRLNYSKEKRNSLSKNVQNSVVEFYNREDNSRAQPGKADAKKIAGDTEKTQTKVLTDYLKNLHCKYTSEFPETKMSLSTFTRLRPTNVLLASFISRNTCQCLHHQNMALKMQCLRKAGIRVSENPENILIHSHDIGDLLSTLPPTVSYKRWEKTDIGNGKTKMKVVDKEEEREKFKEDMKSQVDLFEKHVQRVREQYHQVKMLKENLPDDEMMLQMDFAENFSCRSLNEVQTAYWNQTMVTIHPTVAYYRENGELKHRSFVIVSDEMTHSASTVCAFLDKVIPELKLIKPNLQALHYWTDSPSSQYRNRFIFHVIVNHKEIYGCRARWNYFECGHGKGPCDGLGGTTKRMADVAIRQGRTQIQSAQELYQWGVNSTMTAKFILVETDDTKIKQEEMRTIQIKPVKGTMKLHAVGASEEEGRIMTRETSCYCPTCLSGTYCDTWQQVECQSTRPRETAEKKEGDLYDLTLNEPQTAGQSDPKHVDEDINIDVGNYIAAVYDNKWFVGKVVAIDSEDDEYEILFMENAKDMFRWPKIEDRIWISQDNILCCIRSLKPSGKTQRLFKIDSDERQKVMHIFDEKTN